MLKTFEEKRIETAKTLGISPDHIPGHIAIIMDGNGRWAQKRKMPRAIGHRKGGKTVENIAQVCVDYGIEVLTLYTFSTENWKRPKNEIDALMNLYAEYLVGIRPTLEKNNVRLMHMGRMEQLYPEVQTALKETIEITQEHKGMVLALALNYSGRAELTDSVKKIAAKVQNGTLDIDAIDEQTVSHHLYLPDLSDPDLLVRTASEMRISNFLLWEISYSEFYVTETLWPDFDRRQLDLAIQAYAGRCRRFGGLK